MNFPFSPLMFIYERDITDHVVPYPVQYKNLSLVTGADGILRSRGKMFTQYRGSAEVQSQGTAETDTQELEISIRTRY